MDKIQFTYQRWFLRGFCSLVITCLFLLAVVEFAILIGIPNEGFWFDFVLILGGFIIIDFCFKLTQRCKYFKCTGSYWVEDGIIFIETRKKTYSLNNINHLYGTTISFMGYIKSGMLRIDFNNKKLTFISLSTENINSFSDCGLYNLFETILQHNTNLKKADSLDFFYELKE